MRKGLQKLRETLKGLPRDIMYVAVLFLLLVLALADLVAFPVRCVVALFRREKAERGEEEREEVFPRQG